MSNKEGFTTESTKNLTLIGRLKNNWRKRNVYIYQHSTKIDMVVSVGYPFVGGEAVVCVEPKARFLDAINQFPETAIYN